MPTNIIGLRALLQMDLTDARRKPVGIGGIANCSLRGSLAMDLHGSGGLEVK